MKTIGSLLFILMFQASAQAKQITVIVNANNSTSELPRAQIAEFFMKRQRQWPDGTPMRFFDRDDDSIERKIFLNEVVEKTSREVELFWIGQKLYTGHSAPTQVSTDSLVISLVSRFPGAMGYVSSDTPLQGKGVKAVAIRDE